MDKVVKGMSEAGRRAASARQQPGASGRPNKSGNDPHKRGAMREPAQTPDGERGTLEEMQEALEEREKEKGDWSKGG